MKKNVTYVDAAKFETIAKASGLPLTLQAGFVKIAGPKGHNVYVAATKRVGRVDLSGFTMDVPGVNTLGEDEKFGNVLAQMDFSRSEEEILATFAEVLAHMATLAPKEKVSRKASAPKAPVAQGWSTDIPKAPVVDKAARLEKLKAAKKKSEVASSPEA